MTASFTRLVLTASEGPQHSPVVTEIAKWTPNSGGRLTDVDEKADCIILIFLGKQGESGACWRGI